MNNEETVFLGGIESSFFANYYRGGRYERIQEI